MKSVIPDIFNVLVLCPLEKQLQLSTAFLVQLPHRGCILTKFHITAINHFFSSFRLAIGIRLISLYHHHKHEIRFFMTIPEKRLM